jgi:hypothetical protein
MPQFLKTERHWIELTGEGSIAVVFIEDLGNEKVYNVQFRADRFDTAAIPENDADALRAWLDAHTAGAGDDVTAGIMPQARSGLAAAYNKLVYAMSPAHTVEHEDCQSIPVDGHYEIEYRRGEDNPYVVTSSGDPLDGYKTIEAALDYIHAQAEEAASE